MAKSLPQKNTQHCSVQPMEDQNFTGLLCIGGKTVHPGNESTIQKELLGQWFQTILMTDQRTQPWLSKGFMNYYDNSCLSHVSAGKSGSGSLSGGYPLATSSRK